MSSILTNTSAMVALQTLRNISGNLNKTQNDISTGKHIASAKDNAAIWAITKVMESDVAGFKGIADSLALGSSTIAVAASASEKITSLLNDMKGKIVSAQEQNVDRAKIQTDIEALRGQIASISGAAQFNGLNLLTLDNGLAAGATMAQIFAAPDTSKVSILSSLDRASDGTVSASYVDAKRADLASNAATFGTGTQLAAAATADGGAAVIAASGSLAVTVAGDTTTAARNGEAVVVGDSYRISLGPAATAVKIEYVAKAGDDVDAIRDGLFKAATKALDGHASLSVTKGVATGEMTFANASAAGSVAIAFTFGSGGKAAGGFESIKDIDVTTEKGAKDALASIEALTQTAISAAAEFGTAQKRITIQREFVTSLMDSLKSGVGSLVDADMEEASARLQALQVQQQLGIQALSIANQGPQNILALFR